jgi:Flp pilus assembly secretin CpaC
MRRRTLLLPAVLILAAGSFATALCAETLRIRPGFQHVIGRQGVSRISVGNPDVLEAQPLPRGDGILVVGKKEGETDLFLWERGIRTDYHVEVRRPADSAANDARSFAAAFPGLSVTEAGSSVIIRGSVPSVRDRSLLEEYARSRPGVHLRLTVPEERRTLLLYDLKILEIGRGETAQLGVRWPDGISVKGTFSADSGSGSVLSVGTDFDIRLNLLLADGRARILSNPRLACESGQEAHFLAGGEIPIVIVTPETRTVEWKTYGIILRIRPAMDEGGRVRTHITAEVSTVDHGSGSSNVPGFLTRRVSTHFSTLPGETVMLSGLVKSEMAKDVARVPLLGQIPVIGELFKSRNFRENQSELAIFVTPVEVSASATGEAMEWEEKSRREKEAMRFRLLD